jgi:mannose-6-phosphate isomerase-like protein (cupin superfamily)
MEVWHQVMAPGAETPVHRHACEEVIFVVSGSGQVTIEGETYEFQSDSTLVVPPDDVHQILNTGRNDLVLVAALGAAPVRVCTEAGEPLPVPWQAP